MSQSRRALNWQFAIFAVAIVLIAGLSRFFPVIEIMTELQRRVAQLGTWTVICYPLLFALCNLLLLPGGILCVGSGFFFGLWWGFFLVLIGNIISAAIAFASVRSAGQEWFRTKIAKRPKLAALLPADRKRDRRSNDVANEDKEKT